MRFLALSLLLPVFLPAQERIRVAHACSYRGETLLNDYFTFAPSTEADRIVQEICDAQGLAKNFIVKSANVPNALATIESDGRRVILYSTLFLEKFKADSRTRWAAYSVLAHEIGHHLNGHRFDEQDPERRKAMELEADKFSGSALRMLNAGLDESKAGIEQFAEETETAKYPPGSARREAVASGWKKQDEHLRKVLGIRPADPKADGGAKPNAPDRDRDGTPDADDRCPDEPGLAQYQGCPDTDGDGLPDPDDACPGAYGLSILNGCPDADGDGVPNHQDSCRYQRGEARWQGCPDTDGDGLPDHQDACPTTAGLLSLRGCPLADRDADGVPDASDRCADTPGLKQFEGCPDSDNDGVPDPDDKCPTQKGSPTLQGCPETKTAAQSTPLPGGAGMRAGDLAADGLVFVPGGTFTMGCTAEQGSDCYDAEKPARKVTLSDYYIGKYEVTQKQWRDVMGSNPSSFKNCDECPVEKVSWDDVQEYLKKLNAANPGKNYRLPSEAEWEYAARGGSLTKNYKYAGSSNPGDVAWYDSNSGNKTRPVGGKKANELGLHDMSGNVWEWCSDWFGTYPSGAETNPAGPSSGSSRVVRGGSWNGDTWSVRVSYRGNFNPSGRDDNVGFRVAQDK